MLSLGKALAGVTVCSVLQPAKAMATNEVMEARTEKGIELDTEEYVVKGWTPLNAMYPRLSQIGALVQALCNSQSDCTRRLQSISLSNVESATGPLNTLRITHLFNQAHLIEDVAQMIYDEFWRDVVNGMSVADLAAHLRTATSATHIPLSLIAMQGDQLVGTINLIENDDGARRHLRPWLAALVVRADLRDQQIGTQLVNALLTEARAMNIRTLYFGTDGPGFYQRLGAIKHERVRDDFFIMKFVLG
jgi:predicted N-acetyltransferase YhbS